MLTTRRKRFARCRGILITQSQSSKLHTYSSRMQRLFTKFNSVIKPRPTTIGLRTVLSTFINAPSSGLSSKDVFDVVTKDYPPPDPPLEALKTVHKKRKATKVPVLLPSPKWQDQVIHSMR